MDPWSIHETAEFLHVSEATVRFWAARRDIPCRKVRDGWQFRQRAIQKWASDQHLAWDTPSRDPAAAQLREVLSPEHVVMMDEREKEHALRVMIDTLASANEVGDAGELAREVFAREALLSTGIGVGIAVPHVRLASVSDMVMAVGVSEHALADYASLDDEPVRILCLLAAHDDQHSRYLKTLAAVSARLKRPELRDRVLRTKSIAAVYLLLTHG